MNVLKYFLMSILLISIPIVSKGQNQDLKIDFSYNKQSNSLLLNLCNNSSKEILIMNQHQWKEFAGSYITLYQFSKSRKTFFTICIFDLEGEKRVGMKKMNSGEKMRFAYSFDAIPVNNVYKAELSIVTFSKDEKTNKIITKTYTKEVNITQ